jgi:hypothetical protein
VICMRLSPPRTPIPYPVFRFTTIHNHITTPAHHPSSRPEDQASPPNMGSSGVLTKVRPQPLFKSVTYLPIPLSKPPETTHQTPRPKSPTHPAKQLTNNPPKQTNKTNTQRQPDNPHPSPNSPYNLHPGHMPNRPNLPPLPPTLLPIPPITQYISPHSLPPRPHSRRHNALLPIFHLAARRAHG